MSSIKGYVQMMLKGALGNITEEQTKSLNVVLRNTNRLDNLIQDILDISRLESGTMKFIPNKTNIKEMIQDVAETMKSSADRKDINVKTKIKGEIPFLTIDDDRLKQVIINLVNNAIKFSEENKEIIISAELIDSDILFEVQDFGRGIPEDKLENVFETFYQVDSGVDRKFGGAGLGLAISRGIVLAHGGKIWVESKVGEGSSFKFTIPVKAVEDLEERFKEVDVFKLEAIS
jgi:signal transduction histidine kinase